MESYSKAVPGSNFGTDSKNIWTQSGSSMEPNSLNRVPVDMVSRFQTRMFFRPLFWEAGRSEKILAMGSSREMSPSSQAMPTAVPTTLLLME